MLLFDEETPARDHTTKAAMRAATTGFSIEALPQDARRIADFRDHLPEGTPVYVGWPPKTELQDIVSAARKLHREGMVPVPHIAARRLHSEVALWELVQALATEAHTDQLLLLGGDPDPPVGPYADAGALLQSGVLEDCHIQSIGLAGHPEGHPVVPSETLTHALEQKIATARNASLRVHVVTQFVLDPASFEQWYADTYSRISLGTALRIGVPGIVSTKRLLQLAKFCGLSGSMNMLRKSGRRLAKTAMNNSATEDLVTRLSPSINREANLSGFHFYSFGNFEKTAAWACAVVRQ